MVYLVPSLPICLFPL